MLRNSRWSLGYIGVLLRLAAARKRATPGFIVLPPGKRLAWPSYTGGTHGQNQGEVFSTTGATANRGEAARRAQGNEHRETADQAAAALRRQPPPGRRLRRRTAALREIPRSRHRPSHQRDGAGPRDPLHSALPPGRGLEAPLSRRRFPDGLRAQRLDQPCQLIFLCLYSQYVTSAWTQMVGPLSQHGRNKIFKIRPR